MVDHRARTTSKDIRHNKTRAEHKDTMDRLHRISRMGAILNNSSMVALNSSSMVALHSRVDMAILHKARVSQCTISSNLLHKATTNSRRLRVNISSLEGSEAAVQQEEYAQAYSLR